MQMDSLKTLLKNAGLSDDDDSIIFKHIDDIKAECAVCTKYKPTPPRPVVSFPLATSFNEVVAMDIKFYHGTALLHLIDTCTRFSATAVVKSKHAKVIIENIYKMWIAIFGCPNKFISDNGAEFANAAFREMGEAMNIKVTTTAARSPWSNGLYERYNQVVGLMLDKILGYISRPLLRGGRGCWGGWMIV